jgi:rhodanese-related sulfurtransferase
MDRTRALEQSIRQRCLAVIDVRDDAEVARELNPHESATMRARRC